MLLPPSNAGWTSLLIDPGDINASSCTCPVGKILSMRETTFATLPLTPIPPRLSGARQQFDEQLTQMFGFHLRGLWVRLVTAGYFSSLSTGRIGRSTRLPPQFGQINSSCSCAQLRQKVHSNVQIIASVDAGGRSLSQRSQPGLNSSTEAPLIFRFTHRSRCWRVLTPLRANRVPVLCANPAFLWG